MKKVEKVSIGRYAFTLEENACHDLEGYIEALKKHYSGNADCTEIVDAFEDRMAELLLEQHSEGSVITIADIDAIKAQIGAPDSFGDTEPSSAENGIKDEEKKDEWWKNSSKKKMFRPRSGRILGGVAAALANRLNIDVTLMRVLWCIFACSGIFISDKWFDGAFGIVCLAYIILWICIPSGTYGQEVMSSGNDSERHEFWRVMGSIFRILFGGILAIVGISGIAAGVTTVFGLSIIDAGNWWGEISKFLLELSPDMAPFILKLSTKILIGVCYFIPFIVLLYEGLKICFEFKSPKWHPGLILTLVWFIALIAACIAIAGAFIPTISL